MAGKFHRHFFVCTFDRCAPAGAATILSRMQTALFARPDLWPTVAVTGTGCLGLCTIGPAIAVYPEGVWYTNVSPTDAQEIIDQHLLGGRVVERLVYAWPET
jgi:NADP-reducing hydrogenase subunit HndC